MTERPSIICPDCASTSRHPDDVTNGYCPRCHWWTSDPDPLIRANNPSYSPERRRLLRLLAVDTAMIQLAAARRRAQAGHSDSAIPGGPPSPELIEQLVEELAAEAERGYDPEKLRPRPPREA